MHWAPSLAGWIIKENAFSNSIKDYVSSLTYANYATSSFSYEVVIYFNKTLYIYIMKKMLEGSLPIFDYS